MFYDLYAPLYDALEHRLAVRAGFSEDLLRVEIAKAMELKRGNVVLEVCAGTCRNLALFARITEGVYIGVDASSRMLSVCLNNVRDARVGLVLGYAENLPFRDRVFDRVLIGGCLGHVSDKRKALEEASRVL